MAYTTPVEGSSRSWERSILSCGTRCGCNTALAHLLACVACPARTNLLAPKQHPHVIDVPEIREPLCVCGSGPPRTHECRATRTRALRCSLTPRIEHTVLDQLCAERSPGPNPPPNPSFPRAPPIASRAITHLNATCCRAPPSASRATTPHAATRRAPLIALLPFR